MALLCSRLLSKKIRNELGVSHRFLFKNFNVPDEMELVTGLEKLELTQLKAGNEDPFRVKPFKRLKNSTKNNPNLVPSYFDCRLLGCLCEEDSFAVVWMWLFKGEPKRCQCGHWFKLEKYNPF